MKTAENPSDTAKSRRSAEHSSFDFVQAVCGLAGLAGVRYRSLSVQHFSISALPKSPPFFPASGPATRSFNGLHPKRKFLATIKKAKSRI
jgi:hypothetical protein